MVDFMFNLDGSFLLVTALLIFVLAQRDYCNAGIGFRSILLAVAFFAFCCAVHAFGIMRGQHWAVAYWARVALDLFILFAVAHRVIAGHFLPAKPNRRFMRGAGTP